MVVLSAGRIEKQKKQTELSKASNTNTENGFFYHRSAQTHFFLTAKAEDSYSFTFLCNHMESNEGSKGWKARANVSTVCFYDLWYVYRIQKLLSGILSLHAEEDKAREEDYEQFSVSAWIPELASPQCWIAYPQTNLGADKNC